MAHPLVHEVLIINNSDRDLVWPLPERVRELYRGPNLFVNPAWNLGAERAGAEFLAILNDDVTFHDSAFDEAAKVLRGGFFGMVGPSFDCFEDAGVAPGHRWSALDLRRFGTFMCMRRDDYTPIPSEFPSIWGGDNWLAVSQRRPVAELVGIPFSTEMSTTSGSPEFAQLRDQQTAEAERMLTPLYRTRWWHFAVAVLRRVRRARAVPAR